MDKFFVQMINDKLASIKIVKKQLNKDKKEAFISNDVYNNSMNECKIQESLLNEMMEKYNDKQDEILDSIFNNF